MFQVIFISNNEDAEMILKRIHSNWSRADSPIVIEDLDHDDTMEFLKMQLFPQEKLENSTISYEDMHKIYDAVGGRIQYLVMFKRGRFEFFIKKIFSIVIALKTLKFLIHSV